MIDPEAIIEAKRALGRQLAAYRRAAGFKQQELSPAIHYGRSTIANVEVGRQTCSRVFWERCDRALGADGALLRTYEELTDLIRERHADIARRIGREHAAQFTRLATEPTPAPNISPRPGQADTVDDIKRRALLNAITVAGVVAGADGRGAGPTHWLRRELLARRWVHDGDIPSLTEVEARVRCALIAYQSADYSALVQLPSLIAGAERVVGATAGTEQNRSYRALAWANLIASKLAAKIGDGPMALIVADRAASCAMHLSDWALFGVAAYQTTCALAKTPHSLDSAEQVAMTAIDHLADHRSHSSPAYLSVQGALLLQAAVIAARQRRPDVAGKRLDRAECLANLLHRDGNELWTAFGSTNVELHRLAVAVELGAMRQALHIGDQLDTSGMPRTLRSRRAQVHLDLAAAHVVTPSADPQAVLHLLEAERIAPQVIKYNVKARTMLTTLLGRECRSVTPGLRPLAQRADVAA